MLRAFLRRSARRFCCLAIALFVTGGSASAEPEADAVKWTELRAQDARLRSDWRWQKGVLQATQDVLRQKLQQLEAAAALERTRQQTVKEELQQRTTANAQQREQLAVLDNSLRSLSQQILEQRGQLPPRLESALALALETLTQPNLPTAERAQLLASIEARCDQFNRVVTYSEEALPGTGGRTVYEVLYWGLAAAYALDRSGAQALVGQPAPDGWRWRQEEGLTAKLERLLAIHRDEASPAFVPLPLQLRPREER